ncbi:Glycosyltransferase family 4 protein [uncultured Gammaproteobacteria bacterium]
MQNAALYYHPEGFDTARAKLMGRQVAGEGFLRGFARHSGVDRFYCHAANEKAARDFAQRIAHHGGTAPVTWIPMLASADLARAGCLFLSDPGLGSFAWRRRASGQRGYSLCGITHTTASHGAMDLIADLLVAPVQPWDALICTSRVVHDTVSTLWRTQAEYLESRFGTKQFALPRLPVIPLGVDAEAYASVPNAEDRARWRAQLGIGDNDIAILFMGRLSFHAKAHPLPLYLALEQVARGLEGPKLHLIQSGWFSNEWIERSFNEAAAALCPSVKVVSIDGRVPETRRTIWSAADIFTSLADNIQETFGLSPLEGMAAGLPVVVSDWNGYRETVRDGVDGFRIPTRMPPAPLGTDLANRYACGIDSYDQYLARTSHFVSVDVPAATWAFQNLVQNPDLRQRMGAAGRARVRDHFDWRVVIGLHQELWRELSEVREHDPESAIPAPGAPPCPTRPDPFAAFASYPSRLLDIEQRLVLAPGASREAMQALRSLAVMKSTDLNFLPVETGEWILAYLARTESATIGEMLDQMPSGYSQSVMRAFACLHKLDLVHFVEGPIN